MVVVDPYCCNLLRDFERQGDGVVERGEIGVGFPSVEEASLQDVLCLVRKMLVSEGRAHSGA